jgi:hypothetical protein
MIREQDRERLPQDRKGQTMSMDVNTVAELIIACRAAKASNNCDA